jgi:protease IV
MLAWILSLALAQFPTLLEENSKPPLEGHATLEGQDALSGNVGTLGFQDGFGFSYRHLGPPHDGNKDAFFAAYSPFRLLTMGAGVEYVRFDADSQRFVQGAIGFAFRPLESLTFSLVHRPFAGARGPLTFASLPTWDFGIGFRPARWLSLAASVESFTQPLSRGYTIPRTYALSVSFRPFLNEWLTFGADVRMRETTNLAFWPAPRFTLDLRPVSFLGFLVSATTTGEVFAGLSLRSRYVELGGAVGSSRENPVDSSYAFMRVSSVAKDGFNFGAKTTVQMGLSGALRPRDAFSLLRMAPPNYGEIPLALHAFAHRSDVQGVRLVLQGFECGFATLSEIREAILYLRKHGKQVVVEMGDADDRDLFVASAADSIVMEPGATLHFDGLKAVLRTFKGTLDKLGVRLEVQASGEYKNSPDAFTKDQPGPQQLEAQNALLDNLNGSLIAAVSEGRKKSVAEIQALIKRGIFTAAQAREVGLIDALAYDPDPKAPPPGSRYDNLTNASAMEVKRHEWSSPHKIALVHIEGTITSGESFEDPFGIFPIAGASTIVRALEEARGDDDVKAIVVRINSPGGDILASDFIWQAMRRAQTNKPLVVSMGDVAASGGYYAALPADVIFAEPETTTGSIGVFTMKLDLSGLYDKLGIKHTVLTRGEHADAMDASRALRPDEEAMYQAHVKELYQSFLSKVAHARHMELSAADAVARGRVWSGKDALDRHLVDKLGGLTDAISEAKHRAGSKELALFEVKTVPSLGSPLHQFAAAAGAWVSGRPGELSLTLDLADRLLTTFNGRALYFLPDVADVR